MKSTDIIQPIPLSKPIAINGLKNSIPDSATGTNNASIEEGFPEITMKAPVDGGLPPWGQDFNGMFYTLSTLNCNIQNGGLVTFSAVVSNKIGGYPEGAILDYIDNNGSYSKVKSLIDDNTYDFTLNPSYIGQYWEQIGITASTSWGNISGNIQNQTDLQNALAPKLSDTQLSNCILSLTEGSITPQSYSNVSYANHGATDSSGVLSNFSASNFAILAKTMSNATAWTFTLPFTTGADVSGRQTIVAINNKDNCIIIDNGAIALVYNGQEIKGDVGLSANTAYVLEFIRTTTGYTVNVKQTDTVIDTISVLSTAGFFGGKTVFLGNDQSGNYFKGSIGLATSSIYEGSTKYWQYSDDIDCQTVEVKGNFQLLMPNGRAANGTMTNVTKTINLDSLILYSPNGMGKTVLVTEDSELMARDSYVEGYVEPDSPALNSIWYDKTENKLKQQLNSFPNYSVVGSPTISNGVISNFASGSVQINQSFDLGAADTWEITIPVTTPSALPSDYESITYDSDENGVNQTHNVVYTPSGAFQFRARRPDVYMVNNEVTVSTAYGVQTGDPEGDNYQTGYVQTSGTAESYVATGTQIYSDPEFETPLTTAPENTWTYTGQNVNNTQLVTGYVKEAGVTLVPAQTTVYSDANCTSVQATASGTDYTYSGDTAISYICTLSQSASLSTAQTIKVGFNGAQYYLSVDENQQTYNSTDKVNGISSGYYISSQGDPFSGSINLNGLTVSLNNNVEWEWNGVSSTTTDFVSFIGAKIGTITDNGTSITSATLDVPLTIAKDTDVVHNTGDETVDGKKEFNEAIFFDKKKSSSISGNTAIIRATAKNLTQTPTDFSGCSIQTYAPNYDITDETEENLKKAFGAQLLACDKNGQFWGYLQTLNNYFNGKGTSLTVEAGLRRYINGERVSKAVWSGGLSSSSATLRAQNDGAWFSFPKCVTRPTTSSTAASSCVDVIVKNYYSSTKGYVQFGSGLKIQWGRTSVSSSTDRETITWGLPFSNTNYACVLGPGYSGAWYNAAVWRYAKSTTSVSVGKFDSSNAQCYTEVVAIGY